MAFLRFALPAVAFLTLPVAVSLAREALLEPLDPARELASFVPVRCSIYVEADGLAELAGQGFEHPFVKAALSTDLARTLLAGQAKRPEDWLEQADQWLTTPLLPALAALSAHGAALAVAPGGAKPQVLALLRGTDPGAMRDVRESTFRALERRFGIPGALAKPAKRVLGAEIWNLGELVVASRAELLLVGNDEGVVQDALELAADPAGRGLAGERAFANARAHASEASFAWSWLDLGRARLDTGPQAPLARLSDVASDPKAQFILGPWISGALAAEQVSVSIALDGNRVTLELVAEGAEVPAAIAPGARSGFAAPAFTPTTTACGEAVLYRDLASIFRSRAELFPPQALPAFSKASSDLAVFFGGKDLGEDVLPGLSPWVRVVVRPLTFDEGRTPEIELPGIALVAHLEDPEVQGEELVTAFQTALALINADQGQKGNNPMRLALAREGDVELTVGRFPKPAPGEGVDLRYNLQPALAISGSSLLLASHEALARELLRELGGMESEGERTSEPSASDDPPGNAERLVVRGDALAALVRANFDALVSNKVLEEGGSFEAARAEIGGLELGLASVESLALVVRSSALERVEVEIEIVLDTAPESNR